jgi:hypothetical protein
LGVVAGGAVVEAESNAGAELDRFAGGEGLQKGVRGGVELGAAPCDRRDDDGRGGVRGQELGLRHVLVVVALDEPARVLAEQGEDFDRVRAEGADVAEACHAVDRRRTRVFEDPLERVEVAVHVRDEGNAGDRGHTL